MIFLYIQLFVIIINLCKTVFCFPLFCFVVVVLAVVDDT